MGKKRAMIKNWDILNRHMEADYRIFKVFGKKVCSPRTNQIMEVKSIDFSPWAMILATTSKEEIIMVRQYRHGIEQVCLELPGGLVDAGDLSTAAAAGRELLEETGYQAANIVELGECFPQPAVLNNKGYFFHGKDAVKVAEPTPDAGEDIEVVKVPLQKIPDMIANKEITHGMVLLAFFLYGLKLPPHEL
jgi:8-oxo-dGTP pyrophosphatase MutT (NUDIX family)